MRRQVSDAKHSTTRHRMGAALRAEGGTDAPWLANIFAAAVIRANTTHARAIAPAIPPSSSEGAVH